MRIWMTAAALAAMAGTAAAQDAAGRMILVMDGSGSMWGQIDGVPKLEIARGVVAEVLDGFPEGRELGLIAYGHRTRGQCDDIELVVAPGAGTAGQVLEAVNAMRFQGRTPLTDAVRAAAEAARYTEDPATVVLVTDGIETCEADPCALARELEAAGVGFTAHVVGFGLSRDDGAQVACLATETGGRFLLADDGAALRDALAEVVLAEEAAAAPPTATLPPARLTAPAEVPILAPVVVTWEGPGGDADFIDIARADAPDGVSLSWTYLAEGNPVTLRAPGAPGDYVLRYAMGDGGLGTVLASVPLRVTEAEFALDAPLRVQAGGRLTVAWRGPGGDADYIDIAPAAQDGAGGELTYAWAVDGNPARLQAPGEPGTYALRYVVSGPDGATVGLAVPLEVTAAEVAISGPAAVQPGTVFAALWAGPDGPNDYIDIAPAGTDGAGGELTYAYTAYSGGGVAQMTAPEAAGDYLLRYILAAPDGAQVLAAAPLRVDPAAPASAGWAVELSVMVPPDFAGLPILWTAEPVPARTGAEPWTSGAAVTGSLKMPLSPGRWEIRGEGDGVTLRVLADLAPGGPAEVMAIPE